MPSTTQGLGVEVIGRESTFLERLLDIFNNVPVVSQLAAGLVHYLGLDNDAADLVPKVSFVMCAFIIGITPYVIKALMHLWLVTTRSFTKGSGANARWATWFEIFQNYSIPSVFSTNIFSYLSALFLVLSFDISFRAHISLLVLIICTIPIGFGIRTMLGSYDAIRGDIMPYPLGSYKGMKIYLTGGSRSSLLRGKVKEQRQGHLLVIAPSGAGKTTTFFIPGLLEDATNFCSDIVVEAKASSQEDMFSQIAPTWIKAGKRVMLFDPWDGTGQSFNPLMHLKPSFTDPETRDTIEDMVDAIYRTYELERGAASGDAAYHADQEKGIMKALMIIALFKPEGERNMAAVAEVANQTLDDVIGYIKKTVGAKNTPDTLGDDIYKNLNWFLDNENLHKDKRASMLRGVAGKLAIFTHPRVMPHVVNDEMDLDSIFKTPTILCIKAPLNVPGASTMASIIIRLLMAKVPNKMGIYKEDAVNALDQAKKELEQAPAADKSTFIKKVSDAETILAKAKVDSERFKSFFYLDELPALKLPKFAEFCKTARSSGTGILAAIQDRSDVADVVHAKLGLNTIDGLIGNFKTVVLLAGLQPITSEHFSKSFGKCEIKTRRTSRSTKNAVDLNYVTSREEKLLIQPDQIQKMTKGTSIIVDMNLRPFFCDTIPWYKSRKYTQLVKKNKDVAVVLARKPGQKIDFSPPAVPKFTDTFDEEKATKAAAKKAEEIIGIPKMITSKGDTIMPFVANVDDGGKHEPTDQQLSNTIINDVASIDGPGEMEGPGGYVQPY